VPLNGRTGNDVVSEALQKTKRKLIPDSYPARRSRGEECGLAGISWGRLRGQLLPCHSLSLAKGDKEEIVGGGFWQKKTLPGGLKRRCLRKWKGLSGYKILTGDGGSTTSLRK